MPTKAITRAQITDFATHETVSTGDAAARAFACFDRGSHLDEVVTHLVLPADTVEHLWRTWARLRGLVPLSPEAARVLREILYCNRPLTSGSDLVAALQRFADRPIRLCTRCKSASPEYCSACPTREALKAARRSKKG